MDDIAALLRRYALGTWRRRWIALGAAWLLCLAGWVGVMSLPPSYEASAQVYVAADPVLTPLLHGIAIGGGISSEVALLQRTLLSRPNLEALIAKAGLLHGKDTVSAREAMVRKFSRRPFRSSRRLTASSPSPTATPIQGAPTRSCSPC